MASNFFDLPEDDQRRLIEQAAKDAWQAQRETLAQARRKDWSAYGYPTTIIADRYSGTYSGGAWVAFPLYAEDIDPRASGDDISCAEFWGEMDPHEYGVGDSPQEALEDLRKKMEVYEDRS